MGFTTGFTSGVTLTLGIAYLTVLAHERNRQAQGANLRTQSSLLNTLLLSDHSLAYPDPNAEVGRTSRATLVETAKDRWNEEIQNAVRWVQGAQWGDVKEGMESAAAKALGTGLSKSREEIQNAEETAGPIAREAIERAREGVKIGFDGSKAAAERAAARTLGAESSRESRFEGKTEYGLENASATAREAWKRGVEKSHEVAEGLKLTEGAAAHAAKETWKSGTAAAQAVDPRETRFEGKTEHGFENSSAAAKEAWRKSVEKGHEIAQGLELTEKGVVGAVKRTVEQGKGAVEKAKTYLNDGLERAGGRDEADDGLTDVQRALRQRFANTNPLNKTVQETLAERYKPIDQRTNTSLRGL